MGVLVASGTHLLGLKLEELTVRGDLNDTTGAEIGFRSSNAQAEGDVLTTWQADNSQARIEHVKRW